MSNALKYDVVVAIRDAIKNIEIPPWNTPLLWNFIFTEGFGTVFYRESGAWDGGNGAPLGWSSWSALGGYFGYNSFVEACVGVSNTASLETLINFKSYDQNGNPYFTFSRVDPTLPWATETGAVPFGFPLPPCGEIAGTYSAETVPYFQNLQGAKADAGIGWPNAQGIPATIRPAAYVVHGRGLKNPEGQVGLRGTPDSRKTYDMAVHVILLVPESDDPQTVEMQLCNAEAAIENALDGTRTAGAYVDYLGEDPKTPLNALFNASSICNLGVRRTNAIGGA